MSRYPNHSVIIGNGFSTFQRWPLTSDFSSQITRLPSRSLGKGWSLLLIKYGRQKCTGRFLIESFAHQSHWLGDAKSLLQAPLK